MDKLTLDKYFVLWYPSGNARRHEMKKKLTLEDLIEEWRTHMNGFSYPRSVQYADGRKGYTALRYGQTHYYVANPDLTLEEISL